MGKLRIEIKKQKLELDKSAEIRQKRFEEMFLRTQQEHEKFLELSSRSQNIENENALSQNAIWSAIDDFSYAPEDEIKFDSYFRRYEDLYITECANWTDFKKVSLLRKWGTVEHIKFVSYIKKKKTAT